jgi:hypothetical protein
MTRATEKAAELRTFEQFALAAALPVQAGSVQQPDPSPPGSNPVTAGKRPDIECSVAGLGTVGFELVSIDANAERRRLGALWAQRDTWAHALRRLNASTRAVVEARYADAQVVVVLAPPHSTKVHRAAFGDILQRMAAQPAGFVGELYDRTRPPPSGIESARVRRLSLTDGPHFFGMSTAYAKPPSFDSLHKKLARQNYASPGRLEVIAYSTYGEPLQQVAPQRFAHECLALDSSQFSRVWFFDLWHTTVVAQVP